MSPFFALSTSYFMKHVRATNSAPGSVAIRLRHRRFIVAAKRQPFVLGRSQCARGVGALLAEGRNPRGIAVVERGVGQRRIDVGDLLRQLGNGLVNGVDAALERG